MDGGNWKEMFNAACDGDLELVAYHVSQGVDVNYAHPEFLSTPLVAAILARQETVALYLIENGAQPNLYSEFDGLRPLQAAHRTGLLLVQEKLQTLGIKLPEGAPKSAPKSATKNRSWIGKLFTKY